MKPGTVNKVKGSEIYGDFVGHDKITNIIMFQDKEREFVVTHNANIKPVFYFTGRETELKDLRQRIEEGRKSVLVSGMGGIGKTHICRKLFEEYINKHASGENIPFCHIGYIEYSGDMGSSLQNCLKYKEQDKPEQNQEAAWKELEYLAAGGKLLLFVDNVNVTMKEDEGLKRLKSIPGAVVLTSRRTSFNKGFKTYKIGFLDVKQCKTVYEKIRYEDSGREVPEDEIPDLEYIIEKLAAMHTITIEFLAHLVQTKHWTVKELRDELEEKGFQLEYKDEEDELVNIQKSYETLYDLSGLTKEEQNILEAFSVFPYIPLAAETCNEWLFADTGVDEDADILMGLYQKGWLQFDIEQESYALHPVFARFICEKCKPKSEKHLGLIEACQKKLKIPKNGSTLECQQYISYAESIIKKMDMRKSEEYVRFIDMLAYLLLYIAEYERAEKWYEELLKTSKDILGDNHLKIAIIYDNLSTSCLGRGQYERAEKLAQKSLQIRSNILGDNHPDVVDSYTILAGVYVKQGKYAEAEKLYMNIIAICEQLDEMDYASILNNYNNLAYMYIRQGKYIKAEELLNQCVTLYEKEHGENCYKIATIFDNLAQVYEAQGRYVKAEDYYKKSLEINIKAYGENYPDVARSYHNLAGLYRKQKWYEKALNFFIRAYKIRISRHELDYRDARIMYQSIKETYYEWNPRGNFEQWLEEKMKE